MKSVVGIDVSKKSLDSYFSKSGESISFGNTKGGIKKLTKHLSKVSADLVVLESTGILHRELANKLCEEGFNVSVVNPRMIRDFARGLGKLAKTDKLDAKVIALYGERAEVRLYIPLSTEEQRVSDLVRCRKQLVSAVARLKTQLKSSPNEVKSYFIDAIKPLESRIRKLDEAIIEAIKAVPEMNRKKEVLLQYKCMGEKTAAVLLATVPELGKLDRKKISSLVGLAPMNNDSGGYSGKRAIFGGRTTPRSALFIIAMTAIRFNEDIKAFYQSLRAKGKEKKVALVACMRKMLITFNAMVRDGEYKTRTVTA